MFRTRDFVLFFVTIVFLVVAISVTVLKTNSQNHFAPDVKFVDSEEQVYVVDTYQPETLSRVDKLSEMRRKIAESKEMIITSPADNVEGTPVEEEVVHESEDFEATLPTLKRCGDYKIFTGQWSAQGIQIEIVDGTRIIYREQDVVQESVGTTSSVTTVKNRETLLELPAYPSLNLGVRCLSSDVVGVAQDGSLIRNSETGIYGIFGEGTLIGYALDGYPIYGLTTKALDECGGFGSADGYRYYISAQSKNVLNCYKANPVTL